MIAWITNQQHHKSAILDVFKATVPWLHVSQTERWCNLDLKDTLSILYCQIYCNYNVLFRQPCWHEGDISWRVYSFQLSCKVEALNFPEAKKKVAFRNYLRVWLLNFDLFPFSPLLVPYLITTILLNSWNEYKLLKFQNFQQCLTHQDHLFRWLNEKKLQNLSFDNKSLWFSTSFFFYNKTPKA
jgi:hypothetical protein